MSLRSANGTELIDKDGIGYARPVGILLTSRRTVDLCRVGSCLCPPF